MDFLIGEPITISTTVTRKGLKGAVICNKCHRGMYKPVCNCGRSTCYIKLRFKGRVYRYFRAFDGLPFDYSRAVRQLTMMNAVIQKKEFNPSDWSTEAFEKRFDYYVLKWLNAKKDEKQAGEFSPGTFKNYNGYVKNYFIPFFKDWNIQEIRFEQLEEFKDSLRGRVKGIKTRRNILNSLHAFFNWMRRKGVITEIPVWPQISGDNSKVRTTISYDMQLEALSKIPERHRDPIGFGFESGLRPGEITALKVKDIDPVNRKAIIQRTWSGACLTETTKAKNKKWIPLSERGLEIVIKNIKDKFPQAFVFINPDTGRRYTAEKLNQLWRKYSGLGIDYYSASRHSFCTQIIESGVDVFQAQELMRHTNINSTRRYFHTSVERLRDMVNSRGRKK